MKTYEIAGYAVNGEILCPSCIEECEEPREDTVPFFVGDEFDHAPTCSYCLYEIWEVNVLSPTEKKPLTK